MRDQFDNQYGYGAGVHDARDRYETYETYTTDERSLGELFSHLWTDTRTLISKEVELAKTEMSEKASVMSKSLAFLAAGGFVAYAGFLAILAAIIVGLGAFIPMWLSALIVGLIVAGIGYALVRKGMDGLKPQNLAPQETAASIKETKEWAQNQTK